MVEAAQRDQVGQASRPATGSGDDVVDVADAAGLVTARKGAVQMAGGDGPPQVRRNGFARRADVQRQADRGQRPTVQGGAQPRGQPIRPGQGVGGQAEQRPSQPLPRSGTECCRSLDGDRAATLAGTRPASLSEDRADSVKSV